MAEKHLNTRIKLKIGTYAEWTDESVEGKGANFVLKHGEIGFCEIPTGNAEATTAPTILFKVGNGTTPFKGLKWASALAADVYAWAKKNEVKITGSGNAITGASISEDGFLTFDKGETFATVEQLEEIVGGLDADTNTKYSFSTNGTHLVIKKKDVTDPDFVDYETVDIVTPNELATTLSNYYTKQEVDALIDGIPEQIDYTVTCTDVTENIGNNIKRHTLMQNGKKVCDIDIPTDLVVQSGEVVTDPAGQAQGTYIKLVIANQEAPLYINVTDLIDGPIGIKELDTEVCNLLELAQSSAQDIQLSFSGAETATNHVLIGAVTSEGYTAGDYMISTNMEELVIIPERDDYSYSGFKLEFSDEVKATLADASNALSGIEITAERASIPDVTNTFDLARVDIHPVFANKDEYSTEQEPPMGSVLIGALNSAGIKIDTILGTESDASSLYNMGGVALGLADWALSKVENAITNIETGDGLKITEGEYNNSSKTVTLDFDDTVTFIFDCGGPA